MRAPETDFLGIASQESSLRARQLFLSERNALSYEYFSQTNPQMIHLTKHGTRGQLAIDAGFTVINSKLSGSDHPKREKGSRRRQKVDGVTHDTAIRVSDGVGVGVMLRDVPPRGDCRYIRFLWSCGCCCGCCRPDSPH